MENSALCSMNREFVVDMIMSRLDGSTLAASACTCSDLRDAASDQDLWQNLCNSAWPSTKTEQGQRLLSSAPIGGGFHKFYSDSFPLILCQQPQGTQPQPQPQNKNPALSHASPSDLASLVDVYYKGKCILSRVLDAIPETVDVFDDDNKDVNDDNDLHQWFLDCPFRLDMLPSYDDDTDMSTNDHRRQHLGANDDCITCLPSLTCSTQDGKRGLGLDLCDNLSEDVRLSWILLDKRNGKVVNLSSWKPILVQKSWAPDGEYVLHFGSVMPLDTSLLPPHKFAECKIIARCQLIGNGGQVKWNEISMRVEDIAGAHLSVTKTLVILNQALYTPRTTKHLEVERGYSGYKKYKKEMKRRNDRREYLVDKLYALIGFTMLTTITYGCTSMIFH